MTLTIKTKRLNDPTEDFQLKDELEITHMYVLERGTASGDSSIAFRLQDKDGNQFIAQMTGNIARNAFQAFVAIDRTLKQ